jgi:hypothetical protein
MIPIQNVFKFHTYKTNSSQERLIKYRILKNSVVDPKFFFFGSGSGLISDPDSDPDPACLTKVIRLYKIKF